MINERELIERAQRGDHRAFDELSACYRDRTIAFCKRFIGNEEDSSELAQEVFVRAWHNLSQFRFETPFAWWLLTVAKNRCYDFLVQRKKRNGELSLEDLHEGLSSAEPPFEDNIITVEFYEQLLRRIRECAPVAKPAWDALDWHIFNLHYRQNIKVQREVATLLNRSENTIRYRLYRHIRPLLKLVGEMGEEK